MPFFFKITRISRVINRHQAHVSVYKEIWRVNRFCMYRGMGEGGRGWQLLLKVPGGTPYNGLYGEGPPERGTFFRSLYVPKIVRAPD